MPHHKPRRATSHIDLIAIVGSIFAVVALFSTFVEVIHLQNETRNLILGIGGEPAKPQFKQMLFTDWCSYLIGSSVAAIVGGAIFLMVACVKNVFGAELQRASRLALGVTGILFFIAGVANFVISLLSDLPQISS